jgi:hypothetical protein
MTRRQATIFDEAWQGPALTTIVAPRTLWEELQGWWVQLGPTPPASAPDAATHIRQVRKWTGWSIRATAQLLDTTHTTVLAMEQGRPLMVGRTGDLRGRLDQLHDLVSRVRILVDKYPERTADVLNTPDSDGRTALDYLRKREPSRAYLAAMDAARPRPRWTGLLVGDRPAVPGRATTSLTD